MDGLGVADELEGHEAAGARDVVVADGVRVALDRSEHEAVDLADARRGCSAIVSGSEMSTAMPLARSPIDGGDRLARSGHGR